MYVATFDTNTGESRASKPTEGEMTLAMALQSLCDQNKPEEGDPIGPVSFTVKEDSLLLVSAWCGGRQWFYMVDFFSKNPISAEEIEEIAEAELKRLGIEMEDEDDESDEE